MLQMLQGFQNVTDVAEFFNPFIIKEERGSADPPPPKIFFHNFWKKIS